RARRHCARARAGAGGALAARTRDLDAAGDCAMNAMQPKITIRPAVVADAKPIMTLVNELAVKQVMLPRSPASVIENIRDFVVAEVDGAFAGCGALAVTWTDIAEVRSLAVVPEMQQHGIGKLIVDALVVDARRLGIPRLFAFTYVPGFFEKMGFVV